MSKDNDAATIAALMKMAVEAQSKTDEALAVWKARRGERWVAEKSEESALVALRRIERKSEAARKAVKACKIAVGK
jgi:hypothetical protein